MNNNYKTIPVEDLIKRVASEELGFLHNQASEYCESEEEFEEWLNDEYTKIKARYNACETLEQLETVVEEEVGVENAAQYILKNYVTK
jgi:hypothetical protein